MLTNIRIDNFKSYRRADLPLAPLTVLIGANASGKSNAIDALRLLSWIARGEFIYDFPSAPPQDDHVIRGTPYMLAFHDAPGLPAGRSFELTACTSDAEWNKFSIRLGIGGGDVLQIENEMISDPQVEAPLYHVVGRDQQGGDDLVVECNNFAKGGKKSRLRCRDDVGILYQLRGIARFEDNHHAMQSLITETCGRFQKLLMSTFVLDPHPSAMRGYSYKTDHRLSSNGHNLSGILFNLQKAGESWPDVLELVRSLPEQNIAGLDFIETPRGEVMLELEETFGGIKRMFDATLLSDGTLRVLSIAAAILSAPKGSLVVVEEADNGIHPSRAEGILKSISRIAAERDLRVLITTHNPALLDALPDEAVADVVFCYRDPTDGSSRLVRLGDLPDYPALVARGSLGHLLTQGIIDRFVKHHPGPAEKAKRAKKWLRQLTGTTA